MRPTFTHHGPAPFAHQLAAFEQSRDFVTYALLMEQGTGKTKVALDTVAWNYCNGRIDGVLLLAPNGVHRNWVTDEIPRHVAPSLGCMGLVWRSGKARTKQHQRDVEALMGHKGLAVLAMNIDAILTEAGWNAAQHFLKVFKTFMIIDESTDIKAPGAKRTKRAWNLGKQAVMRRILTGTPTGNGTPLDLYAQFRFLHPDIIGAPTFLTFKHEYAEWEPRQNHSTGRRFEVLKQDAEGRPMFRNLEQLRAKIARRSFRITKAEALPNLPPKLYTPRYFELSLPYRRIYDQMRDEFRAELGGREVTANMVIVRMLRLQQITAGYLPLPLDVEWVNGEVVVHHEAKLEPIPGENVRLELLLEDLAPLTTQAIIWARFQNDLTQILNRLQHIGPAVRYDGTVNERERARAKESFQSGVAQFFVANARAGGRGLTLNTATDVFFYNNYFGLELRQQAEDRAHRIGIKNAVLYHDYVAEDSVEERIVECLRNGYSIANLITGDNAQRWL